MHKAAKAAGLSVSYISRLEAGQTNPTIQVLASLAAAYNIPVEEILADTELTPPPIQLPPSLNAFITTYTAFFPELADPDWQRMLAGIRLVDRCPETDEDWLLLFLALRRIFRSVTS